MSVDHGRAGDPEAFIMGVLIPLGRPVETEQDEETPLPGYVVHAFPGEPDRFSRNAVVSVQSFGVDAATAWQAADDADHAILSVTGGDFITTPIGLVLQGLTSPNQPPGYVDYQDPRVKRYVARYGVALRNE